MTRGIRAGAEPAFEAFYAGYADRMYRYLLVAARGDEERARDVLQDSLVRVIRHVPPIETADDLWRWLSTVLRSAFIDRLRRESRADAPLPLDEEAHASEARANDRVHGLLDDALAALPAEDRSLLEAHYFKGATQAELAERSDSSLKALAMRFSRLRRRMRDFILEGLRRG